MPCIVTACWHDGTAQVSFKAGWLTGLVAWLMAEECNRLILYSSRDSQHQKQRKKLKRASSTIWQYGPGALLSMQSSTSSKTATLFEN